MRLCGFTILGECTGCCLPDYWVAPGLVISRWETWDASGGSLPETRRVVSSRVFAAELGDVNRGSQATCRIEQLYASVKVGIPARAWYRTSRTKHRFQKFTRATGNPETPWIYPRLPRRLDLPNMAPTHPHLHD